MITICLLISLGIGLFQQRTPELGSLCRVDKQQLPVLHRQPVVDYYVHPLAKLPELQDRRRKTPILQLTHKIKGKFNRYYHKC